MRKPSSQEASSHLQGYVVKISKVNVDLLWLQSPPSTHQKLLSNVEESEERVFFKIPGQLYFPKWLYNEGYIREHVRNSKTSPYSHHDGYHG